MIASTAKAAQLSTRAGRKSVAAFSLCCHSGRKGRLPDNAAGRKIFANMKDLRICNFYQGAQGSDLVQRGVVNRLALA